MDLCNRIYTEINICIGRCKQRCLHRWHSYKQLRERKNINVLLDNATKENTPWLSFQGQELEAKVIDIYDGDTITIAVPFENKIYKQKCRLCNIDTAEIRTKNAEEKIVGIKGRDFVKDLVLGKRVYIKCGKDDKYGRLLVQVFLSAPKRCLMTGCYKYEKDLSSMIIDAGLGYKYDGKTKKPFSRWYIRDLKSKEFMIEVNTNNSDNTINEDIDIFTIDNSLSNNTYNESDDEIVKVDIGADKFPTFN